MPSTRPSSVWLHPARPTRDQRLSREQIIREAVAVLDAEGHDGLSMRGLAGRFGATVGSLYWYVRTKDELLELVLDEVTGEIALDGTGTLDPDGMTGAAGPASPPDSAPDGWREALAGLARRQRAMLLRHPWAITLLGSLPNMGPRALALSEATLRLLRDAGFPPGELTTAMAAVHDQVIGAVLAEVSWRGAIQATGSTLADWQGYVREIAARHPLLAARMTGEDAEEASEARFEYALGCLLDGLAARRTK